MTLSLWLYDSTNTRNLHSERLVSPCIFIYSFTHGRLPFVYPLIFFCFLLLFFDLVFIMYFIPSLFASRINGSCKRLTWSLNSSPHHCCESWWCVRHGYINIKRCRTALSFFRLSLFKLTFKFTPFLINFKSTAYSVDSKSSRMNRQHGMETMMM